MDVLRFDENVLFILQFGDKGVHEHVERIFRQMDQDRDGVVSLDEFLSACLKVSNLQIY